MSMPHFNVLHWAAEPEYRILMSYYCEKNGLSYKWAEKMSDVHALVRRNVFDVYVLDPSRGCSLELGPLRRTVEIIKKRKEDATIILYAPRALEHIANEFNVRCVSRSEKLEDQFVADLRTLIEAAGN